MDCPKCDEHMELLQDTFVLPRHSPNDHPPISANGGLPVRAYKCEDCGYVILGLVRPEQADPIRVDF